jgi:hypothetical protein
MASASLPIKRSFGETMRKEAWWVYPLFVFLALSAFVVYSTWAAFQGDNYWYGGGGAHYLSPFYSPEIFGASPHAMFAKPAWIPDWIPFSPALLILWAPAGFRFTCYYYRGAYYKAFWADPPSCAVGEPERGTYLGERKFPLILQNIHRYFLYLALIFIFFLIHDVWKAMWFTDASGKTSFGIGVGTIVLFLTVLFLAGYTFSCHSLRHLVGGKCDELASKPVRCAAYSACSALNRRHMVFAWLSLFFVGFADIYIRLCAMGIWTDWRIF